MSGATAMLPARVALVKPVDSWVAEAGRDWRRDLFDEIIGNPANIRLVDTVLEGAAPDLGSVVSGVRVWMGDHRDEGRARFSEAYGDDVQLAALALFSGWCGYAFPARWAAVSTLERALRLALLGDEFVSLETNGAKTFRRRHQDDVEAGYLAPYRIDGLRFIAANYPEDERVRAVSGALAALSRARASAQAGPGDPRIPLHPMTRFILAEIEGNQERIDEIALLATEDATVLTKLGEVLNGVRQVLAATSSAETFEELLGGVSRELLYGGAKLVAVAITKHPADVTARALIRAVSELESTQASGGDLKHIVQLAACIDDASVAQLLAARCHIKNLTTIATDYFERLPHHIPVFATHVGAIKGKQAAAARAVLEAVQRRVNGPSTPSMLPIEQVDDVSDVAASQPNIPAILALPPWMRGSEPLGQRANRESTHAVPIPEVPAEHLRPGQYLEWVERYPRAGDDSDRQYAEMSLKGMVIGNAIHNMRLLSDESLLVRLEEDADEIRWDGRPQYIEALISRLGARAIPVLIKQAAKKPMRHLDLLLHVRSPVVAVALASLIDNGKVGGRIRSWFLENADVAALGLVAVRHARGLSFLVQAGRKEVIERASVSLGLPSFALVEGDARLPPPPKKMPKVARAEALPAPIITATNQPLPLAAVETLLKILRVLPKQPHPIGKELRATLTQESLETFVWTLISDWSLAGAHSRDDWVLFAAGHLGADGLARKLDAKCAEWVKEGKVQIMQQVLDVLAMIESKVSLSLLYERGLRARFEDTQKRARELLELVAVRRGIAYEELEDELVPELGLGDGPIAFDYGARTFEVKLDERLMPVVLADKERLDSLPRVTKNDDARLAKAARARFDVLRDDLERAAATQILRLERAMREKRSWSFERWVQEVVHHPLLRHLATRIVWCVDDGRDGMLVRVAEDGSLANADDEAIPSLVRSPNIAAGQEPRVSIPHPIDVSAAKGTEWAALKKVFFDYEILQPFAQLDREVMDVASLTEGATCRAFSSHTASWSAVMDLLTGKGWCRTEPTSGTVRHLELPVDRLDPERGTGVVARLSISPGLTIGPVKARPTQTIELLELLGPRGAGGHGVRRTDAGVAFSELTQRAASEILRDVHVLATPR